MEGLLAIWPAYLDHFVEPSNTDKERISIFDENIINQLNKKLKMIGFTSVEIDKDGYRPGKINVISN